MFNNWAMPVKKKRWTLVSVVSQFVNRKSGWRIPPLAHVTYKAWERAVGVDAFTQEKAA